MQQQLSERFCRLSSGARRARKEAASRENMHTCSKRSQIKEPWRVVILCLSRVTPAKPEPQEKLAPFRKPPSLLITPSDPRACAMAASCLMMSCTMPVAAAPAKAPVSLKAAPAAARLPAVSNRTIKKTSCMQARPC